MKTIHPLIVAVYLLGLSAGRPAEIFVAPNGSSSGDGTQAHPLDLLTAFSSATPARPGDTIWLLGGRYIGKFVSSLAGTLEAPITVRSYPGEWAVLDSGVSPTNRANVLMINGGWTTYRDFEVTSSDPIRVSAYTGSYPGDIKRGEGIGVRAPNTRLLNLIVHDAAQGIAVWTEAPDSEVYGCLIFHNGWQAPDRAHGHGIYSQNENGQKLLRDNIVFNQFEKGIQIYGSSSASLKHFRIEGNTLFNNGIISTGGEISENITIYGGATGPEDIVVRENLCYGNGFDGKLIIGGDGARDLIFENNYVAQAMRIRFWETARITGNTFLRDTMMMELYTTQNAATLPYLWDQNVYFGQELKYSPFALFLENADGTITGKGLYFSGWRSETGFDASSQYFRSAPTGTYIAVRPNLYDAGRGTITVYNWDRLSSVAVPLGAVLSVGQPFELRSAQNYFAGPVMTGTYDGSDVVVSTSGWGVAAPVGVAAPQETGPEFNVFLVRATGLVKRSNSGPAISQIADQTILENSIAGPAAFTVSDAETSADQLAVLASSSNLILVPNGNITLGGSGGDRSVTVTPAAGESGSATIMLTVTDGSLLASTSFVLTVTAADEPPTISSIPDQVTDEDQPTPALWFTVADDTTPVSALRLWAMSSDTALVPSENIAWGGSGANQSLTITPAINAHGTATISVVVSDGALVASTGFLVQVNPVNDVPTITDVPDQDAAAGAATGPLPFKVDDLETAAQDLIVKAWSSDPAQIPDENIVLGGTGADRTVNVTPLSTASGLVKVYVCVSDGSKSEDIGFWLNIQQSANQAPTLSSVPDQIIDEDSATGAMAFTIGDAETPAGSLSVWGNSSNPALAPDANILFSGSDAQRSILVVPAADHYGTAVITITVSDGSLSASSSFNLTVEPINDYPVISDIDSQTTYGGASLVVPFTIGDAETPADELRVIARVNNTKVVSTSGLVVGGTGAERTVTVTPQPGKYGKTKIYLIVTDGQKSIEKSFFFTSAR